MRAISAFDKNRFLSEKNKIQLIKGNATQTIPQYIAENPHLLISLLYLDFDIYEPTVSTIQNFLPRMPKGAIIAFDEINNPYWAGETLAMLENLEVSRLRLKCFPFDPHVSYAIIGD